MGINALETIDFGDRMKVVDVPVPGGLDALTLRDLAVPVPAPGEVLIAVHAAGVNRADLKQRAGDYPMPPDAPTIPGLEVAGVIRAIGAGVTDFAPGDAVCALIVGGGYAEYAVAPAVQCLPLPPGCSFIAAAGLPETLFTVWTALFEQAGLQPGETVLIHGGSSGIGTTAIQLARALGAHPFAAAGSAEKTALCETLGAELAINYRQQDFVEAVLDRTDGRGVDVILDMVGGSYAPRNLDALAPGGRICFIAGDQGPEATFNIRQIMLKRAIITGSTLRHRPPEDKGRVGRQIVETVWPMIADGRFAPVISAVLDLDRASDAHAALASGQHSGKIILRVRPE